MQGKTQRITLGGDWYLGQPRPDALAIVDGVDTLMLDGRALGPWDSSLLIYIRALLAEAKQRDLQVEIDLPDGVRTLLSLAHAVPRTERRRKAREHLPALLDPLEQAHSLGRRLRQQLEFLGSVVRASGRALSGRARTRRSDVLRFCTEAGTEALAIISLTSLLVGMILGYLGAVQLQQFGAGIYVANLVTVGVLREMGPLMTAVIMAGRTGAAYAAQLGTMQGNEEIDAIEMLGVSPVEFLVLPRLLGLLLMTPLLVLYADIIGMVGGGIVASGLGVTPLQYMTQTEGALSTAHLFIGLGKSIVFALLIGLAGCRAGLVAERNSAGVGRATTEAVVTALVYLIIADAGINILCQLADI